MPIISRDKIHAPVGRHTMSSSSLTALSPVDGRYQDRVSALRQYFTELGLIRLRVQVEIAWLRPSRPNRYCASFRSCRRDVRRPGSIASGFSHADGARVKAIEAETNHDVKAVEYFLREKLPPHAADRCPHGLHPFRMHVGRHQQRLPRAHADAIARPTSCCRRSMRSSHALRAMAHELAAVAMLARTHGQTGNADDAGQGNRQRRASAAIARASASPQ